ncbi:hypothetical protein D3C71_1330030 [compost metagenome]
MFRVEGLAHRVQQDQAVVGSHFQQLLVGQFHAFTQRIGLGACGCEAGIQAVEHRQQLAQQLLIGELAGLIDVTGHAAALVFQVGALAQGVRLDLLQLGLQRLDLRFVLIGQHAISTGFKIGFGVILVHFRFPGGGSARLPRPVCGRCHGFQGSGSCFETVRRYPAPASTFCIDLPGAHASFARPH